MIYQETPFAFDIEQLAFIARGILNVDRHYYWYEHLLCKLFGHKKSVEFYHYPSITKPDYEIWTKCPRCGLKCNKQ